MADAELIIIKAADKDALGRWNAGGMKGTTEGDVCLGRGYCRRAE